MVQILNEAIKKDLENMQGKGITIIQDGFIQSKFYIENAKCDLELDVLSIKSDKEYIKINLNQANNIVKKEDRIEMALDNDTKIIMKF